MRRAQAALEFLATYGWAFMVILIMIGTFAYFMITNPPFASRCIFSPEIACLEEKINSNSSMPNPSSVEFRFINSVGKTATFAFKARELNSGTEAGCIFTEPLECNGNTYCELRTGRSGGVICAPFGTLIFVVNERLKFTLIANFTLAEGIYTSPVKGEIYGHAN